MASSSSSSSIYNDDELHFQCQSKITTTFISEWRTHVGREAKLCPKCGFLHGFNLENAARIWRMEPFVRHFIGIGRNVHWGCPVSDKEIHYARYGRPYCRHCVEDFMIELDHSREQLLAFA